MSADEKKLNKEIADIFSEIQSIIRQKINLKKENKHIKEGNAFTGALYKARKEGLKEFEFNGKKYPVYEETENLLGENVSIKKDRSGRDTDNLIVNLNGNQYEIAYSADGWIHPYGIAFPGDSTYRSTTKDTSAKKLWLKLKPIVDKFLKSKDMLGENVNEGTLQFKNLKKGDILVGKFAPYKEMEVVSSTDKSAKVKSSKGGVVDIYSTNNYKLKEGKYKKEGWLVKSNNDDTKYIVVHTSDVENKANRISDIYKDKKLAIKKADELNKKLREVDLSKELKENVNKKIPEPIQNLIKSMIDNKIQRKTIKIKDNSKFQKFISDIQLAVKDKLILVKKNPIDETEVWISLGPNAQRYIMKMETIKESSIPIYHNSFTDAVNTARQYVEKKGYEIDEDDWFTQIGTGGKYTRARPSIGKTHSFSVGLIKNGKPQKKNINISVYGMDSGRYELTAYIA
jgi:hypothetical protein